MNGLGIETFSLCLQMRKSLAAKGFRAFERSNSAPWGYKLVPHSCRTWLTDTGGKGLNVNEKYLLNGLGVH